MGYLWKEEMDAKRRVGIVGYGKLGQYLADAILRKPEVAAKYELAFIWNRSADKILKDDSLKNAEKLCLKDLKDFESKKADLIVEVAHPTINKLWGAKFVQAADFMIGSPTALAEVELEKEIRSAAKKSKFGCYIPSGALWGAQDIAKMADLGTLGALKVTMKKEPSSFKVAPELQKKIDEYLKSESTDECILYEGPVRPLCPLAPNNVNTMACAALAGHNLGFDKVQACLVADKKLESHNIDIEVSGPEKGEGNTFKVSTARFNPAKKGAVTGSATYDSFLSSMLAASGRGSGVHFC